MLKNAENIALQNLLILYTFVLQAEIRTTFTPKVAQTSVRNTKVYKIGKFCKAIFPHFSTFRDQFLHFYYFSYALFSCSNGFCFSYFNKNLAKHWNCPLAGQLLTKNPHLKPAFKAFDFDRILKTIYLHTYLTFF